MGDLLERQAVALLRVAITMGLQQLHWKCSWEWNEKKEVEWRYATLQEMHFRRELVSIQEDGYHSFLVLCGLD